MMTDYAPLPIGCQYYNPRRQRRYERRLRMEAHLRAKVAEQKRLAREAREAEKAKRSAPVKGSFKAKVKGFVSRLFGRKTG